MKLPKLLSSIILTLALAMSAAQADPAAQLRELDRQLAAGEISKAEHDRRWDAVIAAGTQNPTVPRLTRTAPKPTPWEFSALASLSSLEVDDDEAAQFGLEARLGYRVFPQLLLSASLDTAAAVFDSEDDDEFAAIVASAMADYVALPDASVTPYLGAGFGWATAERETDGWTEDYDDTCWIVHVGIRQTLRRTIALRYEISYREFVDSGINSLGGAVGVSFSF